MEELSELERGDFKRGTPIWQHLSTDTSKAIDFNGSVVVA